MVDAGPQRKVAALLGQLEAVGVGFDASYVRRAVSGLRHRLDDLSSRAAALLGGDPINLASAPQVAEAGPVRYCSPRHMMPFNSIHEDSKCVG